MKNLLKALAVLVCFSAAEAAAQDELFLAGPGFVRGDYLQYMARPYRDRAERFGSARLEALQMSLAIGDEADGLTLENWGDNRADIRGGAARVKGEYGALTGSTYVNSQKDSQEPGYRAGAYGRYATLEAEASRMLRRIESEDTSPVSRYIYDGGGAAYSSGGEALRWGLHGNLNLARYQGDIVDGANFAVRNHAAGLAAAYRLGILDLGLTADYVDRSQSTSAAYERVGSLLGAQAVINPLYGLKIGLRSSVTRLNHGTPTDAKEQSEFGARGEWALQAVPLTVAASFDRLTIGDWDAGNDNSLELKNSLRAAGAALRPFGGRLLIGAEVRKLTQRYLAGSTGGIPDSDTAIAWTAYAGGAEVWLLPSLALRGSYQRQKLVLDDNKAWYNTAAFGAGYKLGGSTIDASYTRRGGRGDEKGSLNEARLMYSRLF